VGAVRRRLSILPMPLLSTYLYHILYSTSFNPYLHYLFYPDMSDIWIVSTSHNPAVRPAVHELRFLDSLVHCLDCMSFCEGLDSF